MKKPYLQLMIVALCTCAGPVSAQQANPSSSVLPAKDGIQKTSLLNSHLRGNDVGLPGNDETVGNLQGKLNVTPTGAATYSIPISVPPGTAGMTPKLSIIYNSQNQNGTLGMGFSLEGLSAITRAPSNLAQNGQIHGVDFTDADRFSLAGQQLVAVKGTYGQDQTEYRTYIDSQSKIVSIGRSGNGPASFKVWTKGGQIAEYGATADSALKADVEKPDGTLIDGNTVKTWGLDKIQDTAGNYLTVHYTKNDATGELYPNEIDYTGNDAANLKPYSKVDFIYEDRTDVRDLYHAGSLTRTQKRLKEIQASTLVNGQYQLVYDYKITYEYSPNSQRSRITSIQECNGNGVCLRPTTFQWQTNEEGWEAAPKYVPPFVIIDHDDNNNKQDDGLRLVDLNGNGLQDAIQHANWIGGGEHIGAWVNTGTTWKYAPDFVPQAIITVASGQDDGLRFVDLTGNGLLDMIQYASWKDGSHRGAWINKGTGWEYASDYVPPFVITDHTDDNNSQDDGLRLVDLNGNGLMGAIQHANWIGGGEHIGAWVNTGTTWKYAPDFVPQAIVTVSSGFDDGLRFVDLNGNGLLDMVQYASWKDGSHRGAWVNTGTTWKYVEEEKPPFVITDHNENNYPQDDGLRFVDLNGDGLQDAIQHANWTGGGEHIGAWINTGTGWKYASNYVPQAIITVDSGKDDGLRLVDLNGDGLLDIVQHANWDGGSHISAWVNTPSGWQYDKAYETSVIITDRGKDDGARFVDLNGNGIADIIQHASWKYGTHSAAFLNKAKKKPDYLIGVTDGFGAKTSIDYEPLSGTYVSVYSQEHNADGTLASNYPNPQFDGPMYVVYQTASDTDANDPQTKAKYANGVGQVKMFPQSPYSTIPSDPSGQHITTYHYTGSRVNKLGYGFLGFHEIQITDDTTGVSTTTTYSQDPSQHNTAQALSSVTAKANGSVLSTTNNTWDLKKTYGDGTINQTVYFPYVKETVKKNYSLKGALLSTETTDISMDDYANPLHTATVTEDSTGTYLTDARNTYKNDTDKWLLGELTETQVNRAAPSVPAIPRTSTFQYDLNTGMLLKSTVEPDDAAFTQVTTYTRDVYGNITDTTVSGNTFKTRSDHVKYDAQGRFVIKSINALGQETTQTVDPKFGKPLTVTDPNNQTKHYQYDGWGRLINTKNPDGTQQKITYQWQSASAGMPAKDGAVVGIGMNSEPIHAIYSVTTQVTDAANQAIGPANAKYYDALNRNVAKTTQGLDGTLIWSDTFYDDLGRVVQQCQKHFDEDKIYSSRLKYDVLGRMIETNNPDDTKIQVNYDGYKTTTINQLGQKTTKITNAMGKVIQSIDNAGHVTNYQYDAYGNLTSMIDSKGHVSMLSYDLMGRKIGLNDPDKGKWSYEYDALGNLLKQTDANGKSVTMGYDLLNRMTSRTDDGNTSTWTYGTDESRHNVGQLIHVTGVADVNGKQANAIQRIDAVRNGIADYTRTITYDNLARPSTTTVSVNGTDYTTKVIYDTDTGRPSQTTYGNGVRIQHIYNALGFLTDEKNASTQETYWHLNQMDAAGHITSFTRSNGLVTTKTYNPANGFLTDIETQAGTSLQLQQQIFPTTTHYLSKKRRDYISRVSTESKAENTNAIQSLHYTYDALGNVQEKDNGVTQTKDTYTYDDLNRLITWNQNDQTKRTYGYDDLGNMTYKSDVGHYHYKDQAGPHAVTSITDDAGKTIGTMQYDADGNQISETLNGTSRKISYTSYGKPLQIQAKKADVTFYYNADRARFIRVDDRPNIGIDTTVYLGDMQYVTHKRPGKIDFTESRLNVGGALLHIGNDEATVYELLTDNLGSMTAITDQNGNLVQRFSYTPFGEQTQTKGTPRENPITHEGFTGHETLESVDLIHMNGRLYDPVLGRFLSADPKIQDPTNSQSLNRYSYCLNNPLAFTDPTGYSWISDLWHDITHAITDILTNQYVDMAISIAIGCIPGLGWCGVAYCEAMFSMATTALAGGDINQVLEAGAMTFGTAVAFHTAGDFIQDMHWDTGGIGTMHWAERSLAHGLVGGGLQVAEGGHFQDGFLSAAIAEAAPVNDLGGANADLTPSLIAERTAAAAIVGGTTAAATGGNFVNGAKTAAFAELFNGAQHAYQQQQEREKLVSLDNFMNSLETPALSDEDRAYLKDHIVSGLNVSLSGADLLSGGDLDLDITSKGSSLFVGYCVGDGGALLITPTVNFGTDVEGITFKGSIGGAIRGFGESYTYTWSRNGSVNTFGSSAGFGGKLVACIGWTFHLS